MVSYALNKIKQKKNILSKNLLQVYEYIIYIEYRIYNNIYKKKKIQNVPPPKQLPTHSAYWKTLPSTRLRGFENCNLIFFQRDFVRVVQNTLRI